MRPSVSTAVRAAVVLLVAVWGLSVSPAALAQAQIDVGGGISTTTGGARTNVVAAAWLPEWRRTARGTLRFEAGAMYFDGRGNALHGRLSDHVTVGYLGGRYERDNGFLFGVGVGGQSGYTDALSGGPQFVTSFGWRWQRFSLLARHVSNASLHEPNRGETMLLAGWRF